jgi:hypothetical protein
MDEFVSKPRESCGVECPDLPVDHALHPRDAAATGGDRTAKYRVASVIRPPAVLFSCQTCRCSWENTPDSGPIGDRPVAGAVPLNPRWRRAGLRRTAYRSRSGWHAPARNEVASNVRRPKQPAPSSVRCVPWTSWVGADLPFEIIDAAANRIDGAVEPLGRGLRDAAVLNGKSPGSRATSRAGAAALLRIPTHPLHGAGGRPAPPAAGRG